MIRLNLFPQYHSIQEALPLTAYVMLDEHILHKYKNIHNMDYCSQ